MKQRLKLAMALLIEPDLLILDEPFSGLDPNGIVELKHLVKRTNTEKGVTVILSSHLIREAEDIANRFAIIDNGKLVDSFNEVQFDERLQCLFIYGKDRNNIKNEILQLNRNCRFYDDYDNQRFIVFCKDENLEKIKISNYSDNNYVEFGRSTLEHFFLSNVRKGEKNASLI